MKNVKLAMIRKDESEGCPLGLGIPQACQHIGEAAKKMAPLSILEDLTPGERQQIQAANVELAHWQADGQPCPYAGKIMAAQQAVECNYEDLHAGTAEKGALVGSPFFYRHYSGVGMDGLYSFPLGYYTDNSVDRNNNQNRWSLESPAAINNSEYLKKGIV